MTRKDREERAKTIMAMEYIVRCANSEDVLMPWLGIGVADGDIDQWTTVEQIMEDDYYMDDIHFSELMGLFLKLMVRAKKDGGLYSGGVVSSDY